MEKMFEQIRTWCRKSWLNAAIALIILVAAFHAATIAISWSYLTGSYTHETIANGWERNIPIHNGQEILMDTLTADPLLRIGGPEKVSLIEPGGQPHEAFQRIPRITAGEPDTTPYFESYGFTAKSSSYRVEGNGRLIILSNVTGRISLTITPGMKQDAWIQIELLSIIIPLLIVLVMTAPYSYARSGQKVNGTISVQSA